MPTPHTQRPPVPPPRYGRRYRLSGQNRPSRNHPLPINQHRGTIILVPSPHPEYAHERLHMKYIQSAPLRYRLHNRLLITPQDLQDTHRPRPLVAEENPLHLHKRLSTGHKDQTSASTNSPIPSVLIPSKEFTCRSEVTIPPIHHNTHSNPHQVLALLDN